MLNPTRLSVPLNEQQQKQGFVPKVGPAVSQTRFLPGLGTVCRARAQTPVCACTHACACMCVCTRTRGPPRAAAGRVERLTEILSGAQEDGKREKELCAHMCVCMHTHACVHTRPEASPFFPFAPGKPQAPRSKADSRSLTAGLPGAFPGPPGPPGCGRRVCHPVSSSRLL